MIQLKGNKKIIILGVALLVIIMLILFIFKINKQENIPSQTQGVVTTTQVREMTRDEKIDLKIDPSLSAEVVNEEDGLYIYKIKK
jgi:hypothetical protein